jgi:predicted PurR-regulated permease PerM
MSDGAMTSPASPGGPVPTPPVRAIVRVVAVVVAAALSLYIIYLLRQPIGWLVLAGFVALATAGPIRFLERRLRRGPAIALVFLAVILAPFLMLAVLVPPVVEQGTRLAKDAPRYAADARRIASENRTLRGLDRRYALGQRLQAEANRLPSRLGQAAGTLVNVGAGIVSSVFAVVTILILAIFMVTGAPRWKRTFASYQPPDREEALDRLFDRVGEAVGGYVRGALLQALIAGVLSWIVLILLGIPYALPLALVVGLLDLVPLVGATLGAVVVGIVTLFVDFPTATLVWVVWSIVYQQLENAVIQPRIMSRTVAVDPFAVIVSVLFGSALFGVIGALLAIPAAATVQVAIREYLAYRGIARPVEPSPDPEPAPPSADAPRAAEQSA